MQTTGINANSWETLAVSGRVKVALSPEVQELIEGWHGSGMRAANGCPKFMVLTQLQKYCVHLKLPVVGREGAPPRRRPRTIPPAQRGDKVLSNEVKVSHVVKKGLETMDEGGFFTYPEQVPSGVTQTDFLIFPQQISDKVTMLCLALSSEY
jgi:hypothetical protein